MSVERRQQRILLLSPYPVFPTSSGGKVRIAQIGRALTEEGFTVVVSSPFKPGQREHFDPSLGLELREFAYPFILPLLLTDRPFPFGHLVSYHPGFAWRLRRFFAEFDIVVFEHSFFAGLINAVGPEQKVVYGSHNVEYDYLAQECPPGRVRELTAKRAYRLEESLCRRADLVVACTSRDAERLCKLYRTPDDKVAVAPNGVKEIAREATPESKRRFLEQKPELARFERIAFYSGSNVVHNRVAVRWILDELAPKLGDRCAMVIHGGAGFEFQDGPRPENVFFESDWDSVDRYAAGGAIGINPMTQGSGMNLKVVNYLAHRMPTVSTPFGARGLGDLARFVHMRPMEEFAEGILAVDPPSPDLIAKLRPFLWSNIGARLAERLRALLNEHQAAA